MDWRSQQVRTAVNRRRSNGTNGHSNGHSADDQVGVAVVGLGYWGPNIARALLEVDDARVTHVCDLDDQRLRRFSRRYPGVQPTSDVESVLGDPSVDAVVIATPVYTHFDLAMRALQAGKHVMVEKPLAPSTEEADQLIDAAEDAGKLVMCGHTFVYSPPVRAVKDLLEREELGDIYFISSSRVNLGLHQPDVSVIWDLAPHDFSILLYWLEESPEFISSVGRDSIVPGIADVAFIDLKFPSGILAHVELSWLAPSKLRRTVIVGSEKMLVYDDSSSEPIRLFDSGVEYKDPETFGEYQLSYRTGDIVSLRVDTSEPLVLEMQDFTRAILSGEPPQADSNLARNVVHLTEAAEDSLEAMSAVSGSRPLFS